jgi:hypothetical protein
MASVERRPRLVRESLARCELVAVAEDRAQCSWDRASCGLAANQVLVYVKAFKRTMQPLSPIRIGVAVGDKGAIFESDRFGHGRLTN